MQELLNILAPPVIGGVIGYVTNDIAIKMLFRPYRAKYLGSTRLPFTPGIVPRRLPELAELLGREVEARFFNADDLEILFRSDDFGAAVGDNLAELFYARRTTLCFALEELRSGELSEAADGVRHELCRHAAEALAAYDYAPMIRAAAESLAEKRGSTGKGVVIGLAPALSDAIRQYVRQEGEALVAPVLEEMLVDFADRPVSQIAREFFPERERLAALCRTLWLRFMAQYARPVVERIDVGGMITAKLRTMEPEAVEALILSVVRRELRYVVWLGGLLGALIGTVNIFL